MPNELFGVQNLPLITTGYGLKTPFGTLFPPSGRVAAFVRSTGYQDGDDSAIDQNRVPTLAAGLARCRPNLGDMVIVPWRVENDRLRQP
jgi:hypothetical protein